MRPVHVQLQVRISVGLRDADINESDSHAPQAAVDYVGNLGVGLVEIGEGEFLMRDSLHLRIRSDTASIANKASIRVVNFETEFASEPLAIDSPK